MRETKFCAKKMKPNPVAGLTQLFYGTVNYLFGSFELSPVASKMTLAQILFSLKATSDIMHILKYIDYMYIYVYI